MLEIHFDWFLILAAQFLLLIFLLNKILFQPFLNIYGERRETVKSSLDAANEMSRKKEEGIVQLNKEIAEARNKSRETFEGLKEQGVNRQREILSEAEKTASEILLKARDEIRREAVTAREKLRADVEKFSDEIVRKLVVSQ